jgi:hypothetical protein
MAKSRLKSQTLRNPGQSLDEKIERAINEEFLGYYILATTLWVFTVIEWGAKTFHLPRAPGAFALAAAAATGLCVRQFFKTRAQVRLDRKGRDGEREVAEILDDLKRLGAHVLHDIPNEEGNVDHVVISKRGIFVIETKNWSKPDKVWEMDFDGAKIHIPTRKADAAPIVQCRAQVSDIRTLLKESTANDFPVRGVVVFLDWYVKRTPSAQGADIWVLNPKELAGWMRRESVVLNDSDVSMAVLHLKQYVKKLAA